MSAEWHFPFAKESVIAEFLRHFTGNSWILNQNKIVLFRERERERERESRLFRFFSFSCSLSSSSLTLYSFKQKVELSSSNSCLKAIDAEHNMLCRSVVYCVISDKYNSFQKSRWCYHFWNCFQRSKYEKFKISLKMPRAVCEIFPRTKSNKKKTSTLNIKCENIDLLERFEEPIFWCYPVRNLLFRLWINPKVIIVFTSCQYTYFRLIGPYSSFILNGIEYYQRVLSYRKIDTKVSK